MSDLIDRQAAIDEVFEWVKSDEFRWSNALYWLKKRLTNLPSVSPERKPGKWVHMVGWWECNQCHAEYTDMPTCMGKVIYEYCPMCGTRMEVDNG